MNIPKQIEAFVKTIDKQHRRHIVYAVYAYMDGEPIDANELPESARADYEEALGILKPILRRREKARLYRLRKKQQTVREASTDDTSIPSIRDTVSDVSLSENALPADTAANRSPSLPADDAPSGSLILNSAVDPKHMKAIRKLCRTYFPTNKVDPRKEKELNMAINAIFPDRYSRVKYFPSTGRLMIYGA